MAKKEAKSKNELLQKKIFIDKKSSWHDLNQKEVFAFADKYKQFIAESKTERLCIENVISDLKKGGFKDISSVNKIKTGDKIYKNIKGNCF